MKNAYIILLCGLMIGCTPKPDTTEPETTEVTELDVAKELAELNEMRDAFQLAIKEGRYDDLRKYAHPDIIAIGPGHPNWADMYALRGERGMFPYDSIVMSPQETVIMNDSMAYDFGTSAVYTTDANDSLVILRDSFLVLLRKDSTGNWKLFREVASSKILEAE